MRVSIEKNKKASMRTVGRHVAEENILELAHRGVKE